MPCRPDRTGVFLVVISFLLACAGQFYLVHRRAYVWDGLLFYAVAAYLLIRALRRQPAPPVSVAEPLAPPGFGVCALMLRQRWRVVVALVGLSLVVHATLAARSRPEVEPFWDLLACWLGGLILVGGAFVTRDPARSRAVEGVARGDRRDALAVAALLGASLLLRVPDLERIPFVLSGDEASMGLEALDVLAGQRRSPFVTGWLSHPTLYFFLQAGFLRLLGPEVAALRLSSALVGSATVPLLYVAGRRWFGRRVALLAGVLAAGYHYAIHFARLGLNNVWDPFFALFGLYALQRALETRRPGWLVGGGVVTGLAAYFYMGARLVPLILVGYVALLVWRRRVAIRDGLVSLAVVGICASLAALPLLLFWHAHPEDMMARWKMLGIVPSGWLATQVEATGRTAAGILVEQFLKAALAFNAYPDPTFWYRPGIPLLRFVSSVFLVFGLTYAVWRRREPAYALLVVWWLLVIVFGGLLLENPPSSMRLLLAVPPVIFFVALGAHHALGVLVRMLGQPAALGAAAAAALVIWLTCASAWFYFGAYTPSHVFSGENTLVADLMGRYLRTLGPGHTCYFLGAPRMFYGHATIPFLARGVPGVDVERLPEDAVKEVDPSTEPVFVFLPERLPEFEAVRAAYPVGRMQEWRGDDGRLLYAVYRPGL